ncbi:MAG: class I SAM-dependent methyltransferase [Candidatus Dormibacteria bacterium]
MLGPEREQRLVFGEVAELYDRHRPGYPEEVFDEVMAFADLEQGSRVLEVGAGTGKATVALVARGLEVTALEPSSEMAAVARRQLGGALGATVVEQDFESWDAIGASFDLVLAAQSWHWVAPAASYPKAARLLGPRGTLALVWNRPERRSDPVTIEIEEEYRQLVPDLVAGPPGERQIDRALEIERSGCFAQAKVLEFGWEREYPACDYRALLLTQSDHRLLPPDLRERLLDRIERIIERSGSPYSVGYRVLLYLARRRA